MPQFESNELHSQMQLRDVSEKTWEISETSPRRRLRDLQISPLWDVSETQHETSRRCIWDASMPARIFTKVKTELVEVIVNDSCIDSDRDISMSIFSLWWSWFCSSHYKQNWKFSYLIKDQSKYDIQIPRKRNDKFFDKLRVANVPGINDNFEKWKMKNLERGFTWKTSVRFIFCSKETLNGKQNN